MEKLKRPNINSISDYINAETEKILSACTKCGLCFTACPMIRYTDIDIQTANHSDVVDGILDILKGEQGTPDALAWAKVCSGSGECVNACPDEVNPMLMVRIARMIGSGGTGGHVQIPMIDDTKHFPRMRTYAKMQLSEQERDRWL